MDEARRPPVDVWPDNWPTVTVFCAMATQWRVGMNGPIGLDYTALEAVMRLEGIPRSDRADVFAGIRTMESTALDTMRKK